MGATVLKVAGIVLALWLVLAVLGAILSMLKFFFTVGLVAVVVMLVVTLVAKAGART
ncbi:hypothetical protein [Thermomonospora catenispora]|uniref:hypothetical protein n=1 Tax=Thermomonospora catenispora TaxID=2493090 RepID=UPI00158BC464|nr:hypothetical protein [Thermomonospora catenispora]